MAGVGTPVDEDDAVFAEQTVLASIVDETRYEEGLLLATVEIGFQRRAIVDLALAWLAGTPPNAMQSFIDVAEGFSQASDR